MEKKTTREIHNEYYGIKEFQNSVSHCKPLSLEKDTKWVRVDDVKRDIKSFISDDMYESDKQIIFDLLKYLELIDNE